MTSDDNSPRPTHVLLVEDMPDHQHLVRAQLEVFREPAELVHVASTVEAAVTFLRHRGDEVDAVVCDLGLPDGDGRDVLAAVIAAAPGTPVVVLTSRVELGIEMLAVGAQDYLVKGETDAAGLERALRHAITRQALANELVATNREIEHLVYSVSHDLRGPLSVATGFIGLLEETDLPEEAATLVSPIRRSLGRLDALSTDLIEYARSVHGELKLGPVDLGMLARAVAQDQYVIDQVHVAPDMPVVQGDGRLLRHLFENLIGNAIKYASPDRPVQVNVSSLVHPTGWQVNVDDNGRGIAEDDRARVFDMFVRATEDAIDGTGIGLAICRRAIERHRGRIWVTDNPRGPGTRIAFVLPARPDRGSSRSVEQQP